MNKVLWILALAWATAGFGHLECGQVVAGMGATLGEAPAQDLVTLLEGARAQQLPVSVRYQSRFLGRVQTAKAFVLPLQPPRWASVGFNLQLDDRVIFVRNANLLEVQVLPAPPTPTLDNDERKALDLLRDAWERRREVRLYLKDRDTKAFFASWFDGRKSIYVEAVRQSVNGEWLVDFRQVEWETPHRGTWRFAAINPVTVKY